MNRYRKKQYRTVLAWLLALVFVAGLLPVPAAANTLSSSMSSSEAAELIRQELNENRAELKQELENKGYEVSEENLDRYINEFVAAYQNGINYVMSHQNRLVSAMQDAVAKGYSQAQLDQLNESLISQMMLESGFNPDAIAGEIFPAKRTAPTEETPSVPDEDTPETPASAPENDGDTPTSEEHAAAPPSDSGGGDSSAAQDQEKETSGALNPEAADDKEATYFTAADDDSVFASISNSIRSWAFDKKQASDTRKKIMDPGKDAETAGNIIINLTSKAADTVGSVGVAVVDTYYDFIDNVAEGDGVVLGVSKSLIANTANGLAGIFIGSADLLAYTFSRIPFIRAEFPTLPDRMDFGKNIKGPINFFLDSMFNERNVADMRAASGTYGINMKDSYENRKNRPAMPSKREIETHEQKYNQSVDYGAGRVVLY